jgi:hypothetical protein
VQESIAPWEDKTTEDIIADLAYLVGELRVWTEEYQIDDDERELRYIVAFSRPMWWGQFEAMSPPSPSLREAALFTVKGALALAAFRVGSEDEQI